MDNHQQKVEHNYPIKFPLWIVGRGIYALNLIRSISDRYEINLITTDSDDFTAWSNKLNKIVYLDNPNTTTGYEDYFFEVVDITQGDLIIPVGEETIILETEKCNHPDIAVNIFGMDYEHNGIQNSKQYYHNKENFMNFLHNLDIPCLKYYKSNTMISNCNGNYLLKPIYSRGGQGQIYKTLVNEHYTVPPYYIMQKYLPSENEFSIFLLADKGAIKLFLAYKVDNMVDGYGTKRIMINNEKIYSICEIIIDKLNYSGFLGIDFLVNNHTWYPIDFNPRITNGISFLKRNSFDILNYRYEYDLQPIVSTIPYIFVCDNVLDVFKQKSDCFDIYDIGPGIIILLQLMLAIIEAIFYQDPVAHYIKKKLINKIVIYNGND